MSLSKVATADSAEAILDSIFPENYYPIGGEPGNAYLSDEYKEVLLNG
jgi:hypothetical protein